MFTYIKLNNFMSFKDVTFDLRNGSKGAKKFVSVYGENGSGKSTMLRAIAGIFSPDSGIIDLHGNSVSLLSIGVSFQKKLSGR